VSGYTDARNTIGRLLADIDDDWTVAFAPADALAFPGFTLLWGPGDWLTLETYGSDVAQLEVLCAAARVDADSATNVLEDMVTAAVAVLVPAGYRHHAVTAPAPLEVGGIQTLSARIRLTFPVPVPTTKD
jgi:hypothetical protein